jgi:DNA-binding transcriptional ArsR family regulator
MSSTINLQFLRQILEIIDGLEEPLPNHRLAQQLDMHPATVRNTLRKARDMLGVEVRTSRWGYEEVTSWGALVRERFLS